MWIQSNWHVLTWRSPPRRCSNTFIIFIVLSFLPVFVLYLFGCRFLDPSLYLFPFLNVVGVMFFNGTLSCWSYLLCFDKNFERYRLSYQNKGHAVVYRNMNNYVQMLENDHFIIKVDKWEYLHKYFWYGLKQYKYIVWLFFWNISWKKIHFQKLCIKNIHSCSITLY